MTPSFALLELLAGPHQNKMRNHASRKRAEQNDFWLFLDGITANFHLNSNITVYFFLRLTGFLWLDTMMNLYLSKRNVSSRSPCKGRNWKTCCVVAAQCSGCASIKTYSTLTSRGQQILTNIVTWNLKLNQWLSGTWRVIAALLRKLLSLLLLSSCHVGSDPSQSLGCRGAVWVSSRSLQRFSSLP